MEKGKLKLLIVASSFLLGITSVFASSTEFTAKVQAVLPDGTMRCRIIKFLHIDPEELQGVRRGKKFLNRVDVNFNEVSLPEVAPFRARAVRLMRRLCVGRNVTVSLGRPLWPEGKVIADVEVTGASAPTLQFVLLKNGLASYRSDGGPTDDVLYGAEESARDRRIGMWAKPRRF